MAFNIPEISVRLLLLVLATLPLIKTTNIDCNGKAFHCVNSTHFMICVDIGRGLSSTVDDFVIPCPMKTECRITNRFECEYPPTPTTTTLAPTTILAKDLTTAVNHMETTFRKTYNVNNYPITESPITDINGLEESATTESIESTIGYDSTDFFLESLIEQSLSPPLNEVYTENDLNLLTTTSRHHEVVITTDFPATTITSTADTTIIGDSSTYSSQYDTMSISAVSAQSLKDSRSKDKYNVFEDVLIGRSSNGNIELITDEDFEPIHLEMTPNSELYVTTEVLVNEMYRHGDATNVEIMTTNDIGNTLYTTKGDTADNNLTTKSLVLSSENSFSTHNKAASTDIQTTAFDIQDISLTSTKHIAPTDSMVIEASTLLISDFNDEFATELATTPDSTMSVTSHTPPATTEIDNIPYLEEYVFYGTEATQIEDITAQNDTHDLLPENHAFRVTNTNRTTISEKPTTMIADEDYTELANYDSNDLITEMSVSSTSFYNLIDDKYPQKTTVDIQTTNFGKQDIANTSPINVAPTDSIIIDSSTLLLNNFNSVFTTEPVNIQDSAMLLTSYALPAMTETGTQATQTEETMTEEHTQVNVLLIDKDTLPVSNTPRITTISELLVTIVGEEYMESGNYDGNDPTAYTETTFSTTPFSKLVDDVTSKNTAKAEEITTKVFEDKNIPSKFTTDQELKPTVALATLSYLFESPDQDLKVTEHSVTTTSTDLEFNPSFYKSNLSRTLENLTLTVPVQVIQHKTGRGEEIAEKEQLSVIEVNANTESITSAITDIDTHSPNIHATELTNSSGVDVAAEKEAGKRCISKVDSIPESYYVTTTSFTTVSDANYATSTTATPQLTIQELLTKPGRDILVSKINNIPIDINKEISINIDERVSATGSTKEADSKSYDTNNVLNNVLSLPTKDTTKSQTTIQSTENENPKYVDTVSKENYESITTTTKKNIEIEFSDSLDYGMGMTGQLNVEKNVATTSTKYVHTSKPQSEQDVVLESGKLLYSTSNKDTQIEQIRNITEEITVTESYIDHDGNIEYSKYKIHEDKPTIQSILLQSTNIRVTEKPNINENVTMDALDYKNKSYSGYEIITESMNKTHIIFTTENNSSLNAIANISASTRQNEAAAYIENNTEDTDNKRVFLEITTLVANINSIGNKEELDEYSILGINENKEVAENINYDNVDSNNAYNQISNTITPSTIPEMVLRTSSDKLVQTNVIKIMTESYNESKIHNSVPNLQILSRNDISQKNNTSIWNNEANKVSGYTISSQTLTKPVKKNQPAHGPKEVENGKRTTLKLFENDLNEKVNFDCLYRFRGRYADNENCRKFYICTGKPYAIIGMCPVDTVFSEFRKQCTKNLAHCVRNDVFYCTSEGRFSDIFTNNMYYICVRTNENKFIRYKLQCENGYHLNKALVQCSPNTIVKSQSTLLDSDKSQKSSDTSVSLTNSNESKITNNSDDIKCEKEGKFPDPKDCRKYYVCSKTKSSIKKKAKSCDSDEVFDKQKAKCVDGESYEC